MSEMEKSFWKESRDWGENTLKTRRNIRIALPWTANRRVARSAAVRLGGVGDGGPVREDISPVERTISGRRRLVRSSWVEFEEDI